MQGRILIIEDHPTMRGALRLILESEGLDVEEASDGALALVAIRDAPPDVVFLDLNIPGTSGAKVLATIKGDPSTAHVGVVVITAEGEEGTGAGDAPRRRRLPDEAVQSERTPADGRAGAGRVRADGSVTVNVEPSPICELTFTHPPMASVSSFVM